MYKLLHQSGFGGFYERLGEVTLTPLEQRRIDFSYLDEPSFLQQHTAKVGELNEVSLVIEGIHCAACIWLNEHILSMQKGIKKAHINYTNNKAKILFDSAQISLSRIFELIESIGYIAHIYDPKAQEEQLAQTQRSFFVSFVVGVFCTMSIMMVAIAQYVGYFYGMQPLMKDVLNLIACLLATPVLFYTGRVFFSGAYYGLRQGYIGMDFLVAFGASLTFIYSIYASITRSGESYFESVAMIILFVFSGKFLEMRARRAAGDSLDKLHTILPSMVRVERAGSLQTCDVKDLRIGERVHIAVGEMLPCDGVACSDTLLDMRSLSGESLPVGKKSGEEVLSGSIVLEKSLVYEVRKRYVDSTMSKIITLLEESLSSAPRIQNLANSLAKYFSRFVLFIALGGFVYWWVDSGFDQALIITISVIVIACPCALALATPIASVVGISRAYRAGLVFKEARFLEVLARAKSVVFDKTGTLTKGSPKVQHLERFGEFDENVLAHFVRLSSHPISMAVAECFHPSGAVELGAVVQVDSRGIRARCGGVEIVGGSVEFLLDSGVRDSALGEQCGSVAKIVKGTTAKVANLPQFLQSSHSPTAMSRILEEDKGAECEKSASPSLRDTAPAVARQSNSAQAESNQINGARKACNLESVVGGLGAKGVKKEGGIRGSSLPIQAPLSPLERTLSQTKLESSHTAQKVESSVDCHADFQSARNDSNNAPTLKQSAQDSRILELESTFGVANSQARANLDSSKSPSDSKIFDKNAQNVFSQNATRRQDFGDKNGALQGDSRAHTRVYVTAESPQQSPFLAQKPTPESSQAKDSMSVFGYAIDGSLKLICYISDEPKDGAKELVAYLQSNGKQVVLLSGDRAGAVESVARSLGIREFHSGLLPAQKAQYIQDLQEALSTPRGKGLWREDPSVVMIGDGLNDIVALKNADVGISMGAGSDIAIAQSDVIVLDDSLDSLQAGFGIARETYARIYQNLAISLAYNALLIPLALCGFVIPLVAALSMSLSSLLVVGNSLRKGSVSSDGAQLARDLA